MLDLDKLFSLVKTEQGAALCPDLVKAGQTPAPDSRGFASASKKGRSVPVCTPDDAIEKHGRAYPCGFERDCNLCCESECIDWKGYDK